MRSLSVVVLCLAVGLGRGEDRDVKAVVDQAVKAAGGEGKLKEAKAFTARVKGQIDVAEQKIPVEGNWSLRGLDRFRWDATAMVQNKNQNGAVIGHGDKAWLVNDQGKPNPLPKEIAAALLINVRVIRMVQNPMLLRDKGVTLAALGELKVDDRQAVGLKVTCKGFPDVDLFFDKKTGHALKAEFRIKDTEDGQEAAHVLRFDDFKEAAGMMQFTKMRWLRDDQKPLELEFSEVKPQETLDDSVFALPPKL